jgi:type IV pilus assembly protein PilB
MQKLGDALINGGHISETEWKAATQHATDGIIAYLAKNKLVASEILAEIAAKVYQKPLVTLESENIKPSNLPIDILKKITALPFKEDEYTHLALADPSNSKELPTLEFLSEQPIKTYVGDYDTIVKTLHRLEQASHANQIKKPKHNDEDKNQTLDEPLIHFLNNVFQEAVEKNATDIHLETYENSHRIRFRIDGLLHTICTPLPHIAERLKTRIKIISQLDIANIRLPQDGYCCFNNINIRVSTCPTIYGEKFVLRLLPRKKNWQINALGMNKKQEETFVNAIEQPQGLVLVTGPTGSGKTVTLYAAIQHLLSEHSNICSVEDPVEIRLNGVNQVSINHDARLSFPIALKTFLRQDPDIIMIGEIRDTETAKIAIHAAQTGHLVLATLHTNSAIDTINRLIHLGISPHEIASHVSLVTAQRLLRKKQENSFKGRFAIHEVLKIKDEIAEMIAKEESIKNLKLYTLKQAANEALKQSITTQAEIDRVLGK